MPRRLHQIVAVMVLAVASAASAEPLVELAADGRTFLYHSRPGETPGGVAQAFGIGPDRVGEFLAANGITDPTRIPAGFVYKVTNPLAGRIDAVEAQDAELRRDTAAARARATELERAATEARAEAATNAAARDRLDALEARWRLAVLALVLAGLAFGAAAWVASAAVRRSGQTERHARALALEMEEKRRTSLAERQQAAKRIIELEDRARELEGQLGSRLRLGRGA
jgi:hypothetical protein